MDKQGKASFPYRIARRGFWLSRKSTKRSSSDIEGRSGVCTGRRSSWNDDFGRRTHVGAVARFFATKYIWR